MGCGNCGSSASGKPSGCQSNGGCSTGGCNRMNVFNWLSDLPLHDSAKPYGIIEVSFNKGSRKDFYRNNTNLILEKGQMIVVEGVSGFDVGMVSLTGELVKLQMKKYSVKDDMNIKRVTRLASDDDLASYYKQKDREQEVMVLSRAMAKQLNLEMKISEVEIQADGKKATFFYTADGRVDFRELIKVYANEFRVKVEMKQIGARQESGKVGGVGSCGRELCCSTWLTDFKSVNTTAARYQNLSINQTKLSGQCGRLKCCLNYELDTYMDALRMFPDSAESIETTQGVAFLQKRDIFRNLMWYSYKESSKQYPLTIVRVKEIIKMNKEGKKPDELQAVELESKADKAGVKIDVGFVNDVGQITLKALEKSGNKKRGNRQGGGNKPQQQGSGGQQRGSQSQQPGRVQQARPQQEGQSSNRPQRQEGQSSNRSQRQEGQSNRPQRQGQQTNRPQQQGGQQPSRSQEGGEGAKPNRPQRDARPQRPQQPNRPDVAKPNPNPNRNNNRPQQPSS